MLGPSGFFMANSPKDSSVPSIDIELAHSSESGFNNLYKGCKNGRFFIYKGLKQEHIGNRIYEDLLKKDFDIGFSLNHIGICQYFAMISHPEKGNCIVMEWIDGCTLEEMMSRKSIDRKLACKILCELCDALEYIHSKQVIHRDLKPANIMITHNGKNVKIIDFGLSDTDSYNRFKGPAGTRIYAAPEMTAGEAADNRSDIWSLGIIMNEMTRQYRHIAGKCLRRDKNKRYFSAAEVKKAILREGTRKVTLWAAIVIACLGVFAGIASFKEPAFNLEPASVQEIQGVQEVQEIQDKAEVEMPTPEVLESAQPDIPSEPAKKVTESIDENSLDRLFNEAASRLL